MGKVVCTFIYRNTRPMMRRIGVDVDWICDCMLIGGTTSVTCLRTLCIAAVFVVGCPL